MDDGTCDISVNCWKIASDVYNIINVNDNIRVIGGSIKPKDANGKCFDHSKSNSVCNIEDIHKIEKIDAVPPLITKLQDVDVPENADNKYEPHGVNILLYVSNAIMVDVKPAGWKLVVFCFGRSGKKTTLTGFDRKWQELGVSELNYKPFF